MKRHNDLFVEICTYDNILLAHRNARRGKANYTEVKLVNSNEEYYINEIRTLLVNGTYKTSEYVIKEIIDRGKERTIYKLPYYPDRIVQWAIMQVLEPIFLNTFIFDSYASIPNKGVHLALTRLKKWLHNDRENTKYCLKIDIKAFFPSIDHEILKTLIRRKIKDKEVLIALDEIIDSTDMGIPIGNYISQYFANYYLTYYDHWIKEEKRVKYYIRYMDDMIFLSPSKEYLHSLLIDIRRYLRNELKLTIKANYQIFPTSVRGIDFMGYRFFGSYTLVRKAIAKRYKSTMRKLCKDPTNNSLLMSLRSYKGWLQWADTYRLERKYMTMYKEVRNFSDFGETTGLGLKGEKISIDKVLDNEIIVTEYKIIASKFKETPCLALQIELDGEERVIFTSGTVLIKQCLQYEDNMPFATTIIKTGKYYTIS